MRALLPLMLLVLAFPAAAAREPWSERWIEVRSEHFTLLSQIPESRTVALALELEEFRRAAQIVTNIGTFEERVPTRIFVLERREEEFGLEREWSGYFRARMRENYAVLLDMGSFTGQVLKHEYVHFLMHNRDQRIYPAWYGEGYADYLATLRVEDGRRIVRGDVPRWYADWLGASHWMPFERLIEARSTLDMGSTEAARFYTQSWFLVHYLLNGREGAPFAARMEEYLRLTEGGMAPGAAFEVAFDEDPKRLERALERYARRLRAEVLTLSEPMAPATLRTRTLPRDEIAAVLGWLVLDVRGHEAARRYFEAALAANAVNGRALAGLGDVHKFAGEFDAALPFYERAIAAAPEDPLNQLELAEYWLDRAEEEYGPGRGEELLVAARRHFARSQRLDPENPEMYAMNGASYLFPGQDAAKGLASLQVARDLLPANFEIRVLLTEAYAATGDRAAAREELRRLSAWAHPENADEIERLRQLPGLAEGSGPAAAATPGEDAGTKSP